MIHDCLFGGYDEAPPPMAPEAALRRDWSLSFHCLTYATRRGRLIIDDATGFIPSGSCCAVVGPSSVDKRILLKLLSGRARGGLVGGRVAYGGRDACEQCAAYVDGAMVDDEMRSSLTALSRVEASSAEGRDDPRATLYLCYGLLAAFTYPVPGSCAEEVAFLKRVRHERDVVSVWSAVVSRVLVRVDEVR